MSSKSSGKYKPGVIASRRSQELWQICFDDADDLDYDLSNGDLESSSGKVPRQKNTVEVHRVPSTDKWKDDEMEIVMENSDENVDQDYNRKNNKKAYHQSIRSLNTEIRISSTDKYGSHSYLTNPVYSEPSYSNTGSNGASTSVPPKPPRIIIRRDSDLELLLPHASRTEVLKKKAKECCAGSTSWPTWRKVLCVVLIVLAAIFIYVLVMVGIVKGIGGF